MLDEVLKSAAAAKSGRATHVLADDSAPGGRLQDATFGLRRQHPELSAAGGAVLWQRVAFAGVAALLLAGWLSWLEAERSLLAAILMATFICIIAVRCLVFWTILIPSPPPTVNEPRLPDDHLPAYTVLVPMYCETEVAAQLIRGLAALDYPADKLQILFICEEHDVPTHSALRHAGLAENMRLVVVPDGQPRTKPRALNYALADATGDYVVVYDAEDEPEPDQLRKAVAIFRDGPPNLGCLQGHLKIYNAERCWLTRQFAIEYAALFGFILPAFERFGLPITLGGTSNHFPRRVLAEVGAWDPYNVTEDADLGIRLARFGWHVGVLPSATWEEAPDTYRDWQHQRKRWLKGWLQTAIVHTRQPLRAARELGPVKFAAVHVTLASMLLSAFVHPVYVLALVASIATPGLAFDGWWWSGLIVFLAGYAASLAVALVAAQRSGHRGLERHVLAMPVYWLLISAAAYGAVYEYFVRPFHWNKTPHAGRRAAAKRSARGTPALRAPVEEVADQL